MEKENYAEHVYGNLLKRFGSQGWWPISTKAGKPGFDARGYSKRGPTRPSTADEKFEVCVGAILTQNTAWKNVEKAISNLREKGLLGFESMHRANLDTIKDCIRPAGYFNQKAKKLRAFTTYVHKNFGGDLNKFLSQDTESLRKQLLSIWGIGDETADSIILYAANKPKFVVDAYTRRVFSRLGLISENATYHEVQKFFEDNLPKNVDLYKEYHALIVELAKMHCKSAHACDNCAIELSCGYRRKTLEKMNERSRIFAGKSIEKALKVAVPPEVIKESSFIEGIMDLAYLLQKSGKGGGRGGIKPMVRDGVTSLALGGAPVSMWAALFADGCKVVGRLFDVSDDQEMRSTARYFYNLGEASKDFRRMWMSPSDKELRKATERKLDELKDGANQKMQETIDGLKGLAEATPTDSVEHLVHDKLLTLANLEAKKTGFDKDVESFFRHMDPKHVREVGEKLKRDIERGGYKVVKEKERQVEDIYLAFESITTAQFSRALDREFSIGAHALKTGVKEARDFVNGTIDFASSVALMGAKTGHMFGRHYWGQLRRFLR